MCCFLASPRPRRSEGFFSTCWSPPAWTATGACGFRPVGTPVGGHASLGIHTNSRSHKHRAQSPKHTTPSKRERNKLFIPAVCSPSPQTSMRDSKNEPCERTNPKYRNRDICELLTKLSSLLNHFHSQILEEGAKTMLAISHTTTRCRPTARQTLVSFITAIKSKLDRNCNQTKSQKWARAQFPRACTMRFTSRPQDFIQRLVRNSLNIFQKLCDYKPVHTKNGNFSIN